MNDSFFNGELRSFQTVLVTVNGQVAVSSRAVLHGLEKNIFSKLTVLYNPAVL